MSEHARRSPAEPVIVARDAERGLLSGFLDPAGYLVLASRAGIAEARLPWVGLTDLLRGPAAAVLPALPSPQRQALQVVMPHSGRSGGPPLTRPVSGR
jgi:hypothetical protein